MNCPRFLSVVGLGALLLAAGAALAAGEFLAELEDLSLPAGLTEQPGGMLFESPTGRIVEAVATGNLGAAEVRAFYAATLPQLGWERLDDAAFRRDKEVLHIDIEDKKRPLSVHFSVVPQ